MGKMMDFHVHRQILKILGEMLEDLAGAKKRRDSRDPQEYLNFFAQLGQVCQEFDFHNTHYGRILDRLAGMLEKAARKGHLPVKKELRLCEELLSELVSGIRKEKAVKKGIVFLPYLASMWDCMESVWQAAAKDTEHCNAYVIPIPYCRRKEDGSAAQWFYDGENFPKDVPLLPWDKIDLEAWHPDVIVIHNPYEDRSLATSVEPRYYPSVLKECTDKLVYIPYFIVREAVCKDPDSEQVKLLANSSGMWHGDVIILHSKAEKEAYIKGLEKWRTPEYWQKHIFALGSPKVDKLRGTKRDESSLPEGWKEIIGGRKVVLYNTSIVELLDKPKDFLAKLQDTFRYFQGKKQVVLWWRPHPLLRDTVESMHPELLAEYEDMVSSYQQAAYGIYDDTADMHRAIAWSDAYYGDASSVLVLYSMTGKPMLAQNCKVRHCQEAGA